MRHVLFSVAILVVSASSVDADERFVSPALEHELIETTKPWSEVLNSKIESPFSRAAWKQSIAMPGASQIAMVDSLCKSKEFNTATRSELHVLIGKPDNWLVGTDGAEPGTESWQLTHNWCGNAGWTGLEVRFTNEHVSAYRLTTGAHPTQVPLVDEWGLRLTVTPWKQATSSQVSQ